MFLKRVMDWFKSTNFSLITDEEVEYYRQNPDQLEEMTKEGRGHRSILPIGFGLGLILVFTSKVVGYYDPFGSEFFLNEVIVDMVFELGVAVWGGVMTSTILEIIESREREANREFRKEILKRIRSYDNVSNEPQP